MNHTITGGSDHDRVAHSPGLGRQFLARWPSIVGLFALVANVQGGPDSHVTAMIIILAAACYVAAAALGSRRSAWVMVGVAVLAVVIARLTGLDQTVVLLVMGAGFAVFGFLRGSKIDRRELGLQTLAFVGFSALALTAMMSDPVPGAYVAASAAIGHAIWNAVCFFRNKAVSRTFAEACFVLDLGLGLLLLLAVWNVIPS